MKKNRLYYAVGAVLLLLFAGFSYSEFKSALTPYVPYEVARASDERVVQVAGGLEKDSSSYDGGYLRFTLEDEESDATLKVRYEGLKPANFEDAISIVAIGSFDAATDEFDAEKLLVKCPSKYQGIEGAETKAYSSGDTAGYEEEIDYSARSHDSSPEEASIPEAE
jgi:cytochrome c-type biogenesis protein CcmE